MIRLAVCGNVAIWQAVASRLHGAVIATFFDANTMTELLKGHDGALLFASQTDDDSIIERNLSEKRPVLVASGSWLTLDRLESWATISQQSGVPLSVVNPDHFLPSRQLIRQQLDAGKLGAPGLVRMHRWDDAYAQQSAMPSSLVRDLELANWIVGKSPTLVYATETPQSPQALVYTRNIQVHLGFPDGAMALIDYTNGLPPGAGYCSLSVIGSAGSAYADDHQNMQLLYQGDHPRAVRTDEEVRRWVNLAQDFVDAIKTGRDVSDGIVNWRKALTVIKAVEQSLASRQAITLEDR